MEQIKTRKKYDILLISPPLIWGQESRMDIKPPLNLMYLASYLEKRDIKVQLLDVLSEKLKLEDLLNHIKKAPPPFLGIPFYHASLDTVLKLCQKVKERFPSIKIIGGGPSMTIYWKELLSYDEIDFGVIGEGEITLEKIITSSKKDYNKIDGLAFKSDGAVKLNRRRKHINLDLLPYLNYNFVNMKPYFNYQKKLNVPESIFLVNSRGCPYKCIYCATPELWPGPSRRYSVDRTIEEIKFQSLSFPDTNIGFMDDSFFTDRKWLNNFLEKIKKLNKNFCCIGRADHLNKELIEKLSASGCHYVALGIETGNKLRQKKIKKYLDLEKTRENVKHLVKNNILTKCFFMLGFPDETIEEMIETINLAVDLRKIGMFKFNFFPVVVYPGTELAKKFGKSMFKSKIYEDYNEEVSAIKDFGQRSLSLYSTIPDEDINDFLTGKEIIELTKLAYNKVENREYINTAEVENLLKMRSEIEQKN